MNQIKRQLEDEITRLELIISKQEDVACVAHARVRLKEVKLAYREYGFEKKPKLPCYETDEFMEISDKPYQDFVQNREASWTSEDKP